MTGVRAWLSHPLFLLGWALAVMLAAPSVAAGATDLGQVGFGSIVVDDAHQHVYVSEPDANAIVELDYQGNVISTIDGVYRPWGMSVVGNDLYVAELDSGTVARIDLTSQPSTPQPLATGLDRPLWVTTAAGRLWVALGQGSSSHVVSIDPSSGLVSEPSATYTDPDIASSPGDPNSLYIGEDFVSGGAIHRLDATQNPPAEMATYPPKDYDNIQDLVVSPDGSRVIPASGSPYYLEELCAATLKPDGIRYAFDAYPFADAVSASGLLAGGLSGFSTPNVYVYKLGVPSAFFTATAIGSEGVFAHGLALTADGTRLFAVSKDSSGNTIVNDFNVPAPPSTAPTNPCPAIPATAGAGSGAGSGGTGPGGPGSSSSSSTPDSPGSFRGGSVAAVNATTRTTVVICGPWSDGGRAERAHAIKPGPSAYERSHHLYWYWAVRPRRCQLVRKGESPDVHVWVIPSRMQWSVWTSTRAVGHGIAIDMGTSRITVTLSRPRTVCGHRAFTQATFAHWGTMRLRDACL